MPMVTEMIMQRCLMYLNTAILQQLSLCSSDMERAIQKASKLISLKSITAKPEIKENRELSEKEKELLDKKRI